MIEKSSALLTGYAWVGFQCAKCKHDFLPWEEGVNKFNLCMCSCSVCCLSHTAVPLWCEEIAGAMCFFKFCKHQHRQYPHKEKCETVLPIFPKHHSQKCPSECSWWGKRLSRVLLGHLVLHLTAKMSAMGYRVCLINSIKCRWCILGTFYICTWVWKTYNVDF